jgi:hypothetical protein
VTLDFKFHPLPSIKEPENNSTLRQIHERTDAPMQAAYKELNVRTQHRGQQYSIIINVLACDM